MGKKGRKTKAVLFALVILTALLLCSCSGKTTVCYYAYFENSAYAMVYVPSSGTFYCIRLPLEQILLWGKASGLDSIPIAMRNYVGLKDSGFILGTADTLQTIRDMLDALGSESDEPASSGKRVDTMILKAPVLSKKPVSDKMNQLCGQDAENLLKFLADRTPKGLCYDAHAFFDTDDLNFSQRYFSQWLEQVLGGIQ
ncbi:MAG: hypothetical protein J5775_01370 [Spirochaetales bacterium]|nr:hypothetical protein [Spirochaetales bacterium]